MTWLIVIGGIVGYIFAAGVFSAATSRVEDTDEERSVGRWMTAFWPIALALLVGMVIFETPGILVDAIQDRRQAKADRAKELAKSIAALELDNGIGGES